MIVDDCARGIALVVDKLDAQLKAAQADNEAASVLAMRVEEENQQVSGTQGDICHLEGRMR
jgi:hypothetical protein